jgi:hypothetical protein
MRGIGDPLPHPLPRWKYELVSSFILIEFDPPFTKLIIQDTHLASGAITQEIVNLLYHKFFHNPL